MSNEPGPDPHQPREGRRLTVWQIAKSTLAAAFGVQTPEARERDFQHGNPLAFIIAGIVFTAAFVIILVIIVNLVLAGADTA